MPRHYPLVNMSTGTRQHSLYDVVRALFLDALRSRDDLRADRRRVLVATSKAR